MVIGFLTARQERFDDVVLMLRKRVAKSIASEGSGDISRSEAGTTNIVNTVRRSDGCDECEGSNDETCGKETLTAVSFLTDGKLPNGLDAVVVDIEYVEMNGQSSIKKMFSQCRERAVAALIGVPEYPEQLCTEIIEAYNEIVEYRKNFITKAKAFDDIQLDFESEENRAANQESEVETQSEFTEYSEDDNSDSEHGKSHEINDDNHVFETKESHKTALIKTVNRHRISNRVFRAGVAGVGVGAGASFISMSLALELSSQFKKYNKFATLISVGDTDVFEIIGIEKHFTQEPFFRFTDAISENSNIRGIKNMNQSVNWVIRSPEDSCCDLSAEENRRLLYRADGSAVIWDFSAKRDTEEIITMAQELDMLIAVIDPLPSKILTNYDVIEAIKSVDIPTVNIINKNNRGIKKRQALSFLDIKAPFYIDFIDPEYIYDAEYRGIPPYSIKEVKKQMYNTISETAALILSDII